MVDVRCGWGLIPPTTVASLFESCHTGFKTKFPSQHHVPKKDLETLLNASAILICYEERKGKKKKSGQLHEEKGYDVKVH